ncbi:MAG: CPBP family intramembrane glutamic endopeptidase [Gemmatimonadaceae bacterium]
MAVFTTLAVAGAITQARTHATAAAVPSHPSLIPLYLSLIVAEWALVLYVRIGIRRTATTISDLLGDAIGTRRKLVTDILLGIGVWGAWALIELAWTHWWGASSGVAVRTFLARRPEETVVWIALSASAGFAEELAFRGYLQRQFTALTGSAALALSMQAVLFGVSHGYQGLGACARITVFGILFGLLARWQRRLRPGIIAHALTDIIAGLA